MNRWQRGIGILLLLGMGGCAPRVLHVPELDVETIRQRHDRAVEARLRHGSVAAELSAWPSGRALPRLPGVSAQLVLRAPDAFRLRVGSMFGIALDIAARGDSLTAYVPSRRLVLETGTAGDSLGLADPGNLGYRMWSAVWTPPAAAWRDAAREDSALVLRWMEAEDSLALAVGASGLPQWVEAWRDRGVRVRADYGSWAVFDGVAWPSTIAVGDRGGDYSLRCRVRDVRLRQAAGDDRLDIRIPDDARRVTREELRHALDRWGKL